MGILCYLEIYSGVGVISIRFEFEVAHISIVVYERWSESRCGSLSIDFERVHALSPGGSAAAREKLSPQKRGRNRGERRDHSIAETVSY